VHWQKKLLTITASCLLLKTLSIIKCEEKSSHIIVCVFCCGITGIGCL
jgi:hypothetical protein